MTKHFKVSLSAPELQVEGGQIVDLVVSVKNLSQVVDQYRLDIKGLDPRWYEIKVASVSLFPQDQDQLTIVFKPPKSSEALAGDHNFKIFLYSREYPDETFVTTFNLKILPYFSYEAKLSPEKLSTRGPANLHIDIENRGNTPIGFEFAAEDSERSLNYQFKPEITTVQPAKVGSVSLKVTQKKRKFIGSGESYEPEIKVIPKEHPEASKSFVANLTFKPTIPVWLLVLLSLLLIGGIIYFLLFFTKGPEIVYFEANPTHINPGEEVTLRWEVKHAKKVDIKPAVGVSFPIKGTFKIYPKETTKYRLIAAGKLLRKTEKDLIIRVGLKILYFRARSGNTVSNHIVIPKGKSFTLEWKVEGVSKVSIDPDVGTQPAHGKMVLTPTDTTRYALKAQGPNGPEVRYVTVSILSPPVIHSFEAENNQVPYGHKVTINWNVSGVDRVKIKGLGEFKAIGSTTWKATKSHTFILEAKNASGTRTASLHIQVTDKPSAPLVVYFNAKPSEITEGTPVTLSWKVLGVKQVVLKNLGIELPSQFEKIVYPKKSTTYVLIAANNMGKKEVKTKVKVIPKKPKTVEEVKIYSFRAEPSEVDPGMPVRISWNVKGVSEVDIEGIGTNLPPEGSKEITPKVTTKLSLKAGSIRRDIIVKVRAGGPPEILTYKAEPSRLKVGQKSLIIWEVKNATKVDIRGIGEDLGQKGRWVVAPLKTTTYVLIATNERGQKATQNLLIEVESAEPLKILSFEAEPSEVHPGERVKLSWNVTGAESVSIEGIGEALPLQGTKIVTIDKKKRFTLIAKGYGGGIVKRSLEINVIRVLPRPHINSFLAEPSNVDEGEEILLSWDVENAKEISLIWNDEIGRKGRIPLNMPKGEKSFIPKATTHFQLIAIGEDPEIKAVKEAQVIVIKMAEPPVIERFAADPPVLLAFRGETTVISWKVKDADVVKIEPEIGIVPPEGSITKKIITPGERIYTLTAKNKNGIVRKKLIIKVTFIK